MLRARHFATFCRVFVTPIVANDPGWRELLRAERSVTFPGDAEPMGSGRRILRRDDRSAILLGPSTEQPQMILEAVITKEELTSFLDRFLPVTVDLEQGRWLRLDRVKNVAVIADRGVLVESSAELHWPIAGVATHANVPSLRASLVPQIGKRDGHDVLEIVLRLEDADIKHVPELLEPAITGAINVALERNPLVWDFSAMLGHRFDGPAKLGGIASITTKVVSGKERVSEHALALALVLDIAVERVV